MSSTAWLWMLSYLVLIAQFYFERRRNKKYREAIHALLSDEGYVEGEAELFVDETLRMTAQLKMPEPSARDFAHALLRQPGFRRAVTHAELHEAYIAAYGRKV